MCSSSLLRKSVTMRPSITSNEAATIRSLLACEPVSEKERIRASGLASRTFERARNRAYSEGWVVDRYLPDPRRLGLPLVTFAIARPFVDRISSLSEKWESDPHNVLLWRWPDILFGAFISRSPQRDLLDEASPPGEGIKRTYAIMADVRKTQILSFFDFEGSWSRLMGLSGSLSYPHSLPTLIETGRGVPLYTERERDKAQDMVSELQTTLKKADLNFTNAKFTLIWLLDDFSGSGNTYIRFDKEQKRFKGKIKKIYDQLHRAALIDPSHYEVFLLLYAATRQAIDHIEYWSERFTSENGYKPLQIRVLCPIERDVSLSAGISSQLANVLNHEQYCDQRVVDVHFRTGGTGDARWGFAGCALPLVLAHNTPNNSVYVLWGPEWCTFSGLFPRVSRHREF